MWMLPQRCGVRREAYWQCYMEELLPGVYISWTFSGFFSCVSEETWWCDTSWHILVLWLLQGAKNWKQASLVSCSQSPAVSCPLCKLPVNEWAGHLTSWGSTLGSSDHQLLCLGLSHAPVNMMNPDQERKACNSPYASSLLLSNIRLVWITALTYWDKTH